MSDSTTSPRRYNHHGSNGGSVRVCAAGQRLPPLAAALLEQHAHQRHLRRLRALRRATVLRSIAAAASFVTRAERGCRPDPQVARAAPPAIRNPSSGRAPHRYGPAGIEPRGARARRRRVWHRDRARVRSVIERASPSFVRWAAGRGRRRNRPAMLGDDRAGQRQPAVIRTTRTTRDGGDVASG